MVLRWVSFYFLLAPAEFSPPPLPLSVFFFSSCLEVGGAQQLQVANYR